MKKRESRQREEVWGNEQKTALEKASEQREGLRK